VDSELDIWVSPLVAVIADSFVDPDDASDDNSASAVNAGTASPSKAIDTTTAFFILLTP
jgi:hypothetical protein